MCPTKKYVLQENVVVKSKILTCRDRKKRLQMRPNERKEKNIVPKSNRVLSFSDDGYMWKKQFKLGSISVTFGAQ